MLTAKYESNIITITYDLDGGTGLKETTIKKGETIKILEKPTKKDYKFLKWTLNDEEFSFDKEITENITLKAIWEPIILTKEQKQLVDDLYLTYLGEKISYEWHREYSALTTFLIWNSQRLKSRVSRCCHIMKTKVRKRLSYHYIKRRLQNDINAYL